MTKKTSDPSADQYDQRFKVWSGLDRPASGKSTKCFSLKTRRHRDICFFSSLRSGREPLFKFNNRETQKTKSNNSPPLAKTQRTRAENRLHEGRIGKEYLQNNHPCNPQPKPGILEKADLKRRVNQ